MRTPYREMKMKKLLLNLALLFIAGFAVPVLAADAPKPTLNSGDTAWIRY
jgi:hypothetical protein